MQRVDKAGVLRTSRRGEKFIEPVVVITSCRGYLLSTPIALYNFFVGLPHELFPFRLYYFPSVFVQLESWSLKASRLLVDTERRAQLVLFLFIFYLGEHAFSLWCPTEAGSRNERSSGIIASDNSRSGNGVASVVR